KGWSSSAGIRATRTVHASTPRATPSSRLSAACAKARSLPESQCPMNSTTVNTALPAAVSRLSRRACRPWGSLTAMGAGDTSTAYALSASLSVPALRGTVDGIAGRARRHAADLRGLGPSDGERPPARPSPGRDALHAPTSRQRRGARADPVSAFPPGLSRWYCGASGPADVPILSAARFLDTSWPRLPLHSPLHGALHWALHGALHGAPLPL